jgi:hypothetical protein
MSWYGVHTMHDNRFRDVAEQMMSYWGAHHNSFEDYPNSYRAQMV